MRYEAGLEGAPWAAAGRYLPASEDARSPPHSWYGGRAAGIAGAYVNTSADYALSQGLTWRAVSNAATDVFRLSKPRITAMILVTGLGGMWLATRLAGATIVWWRAIVTLAALAFVVSSANALNMYIERDIDGLMRRTKDRPLPARRLPSPVALVFAFSWAVFALPVMALAGGWLTAALGAFSLVVYAFIYTPLKRVTTAALLIGAIPGAMPPLIGYVAVRQSIDAAGLALFGVLFFWQVPHFLAIATFRRDDYTRAGIKVTPELKGVRVTRRQSIVHTVLLIVVSLALVPLGVDGWLYPVAAIGLGLAFLVSAIGKREHVAKLEEEAHAVAWSKGLFFRSLIYLPALLAALMLSV